MLKSFATGSESKMLLKLCTFFLLCSQVLGKNELYSGYKVYNVKLDTEEEQERFQLIKNDQDALDFWRLPSWERNVVGRVMVPASHQDWFERKLKEMSIDVDIYLEDVLEYLTEKDKTTYVRDGSTRDFNLSGFYRYDEILNHLRDLEATYANSVAISMEIVEFGRTAQDRPLVYVKINRSNSDGTKPVVIIEAGINPREWITIPSAVNVVYNILNEGQSRFLDNYDWIVIPVANPDGYEYTHTNLRLWEKSRSTNSNLGFICPGVNINRNFYIDWGVSGSSSSPCSNIYAGVGPFSEIESQMIAAIIEEHSSRLDLYISLQNNGGVISYPWYYERAATGMFKNNHLLGLQIVDAMTSNYTLGVSSVVVDRTSGTGSDFARSNGVRYTYNIDIEHSEDGNVLIPEESIERIVNDVWTAISVAADNI